MYYFDKRTMHTTNNNVITAQCYYLLFKCKEGLCFSIFVFLVWI